MKKLKEKPTTKHAVSLTLSGQACRPLNSHGFTVRHTLSLPFSQSHSRLVISHGFTIFEWVFSRAQSFLKKQAHAAHSNATEECISSMINKNKTSSRS